MNFPKIQDYIALDSLLVPIFDIFKNFWGEHSRDVHVCCAICQLNNADAVDLQMLKQTCTRYPAHVTLYYNDLIDHIFICRALIFLEWSFCRNGVTTKRKKLQNTHGIPRGKGVDKLGQLYVGRQVGRVAGNPPRCLLVWPRSCSDDKRRQHEQKKALLSWVF